MPTLETDRLVIRPFSPDEFDAVYRLFDEEIYPPGWPRERRLEWLRWAAANPRGLELVGQPPYGDRAVTLHDGTLVGSVGLVPEVVVLPAQELQGRAPFSQAEVALFWAIGPAHRRQGYAVEAARTLIDHMFTVERLARIIAQTTEQNIASQGVMRKLGMRLVRIDDPFPPWMQVVGMLENAVGMEA
jgi:RimJ/RimL family protein N-acetyltransferase